MERPILFSTPMVQAILQGRKTQTRRVIKEAKGWDYNWHVAKIKEEHKDGINRYEMRCGSQYSTKIFKCPYGKVGDILWVKETSIVNKNACRRFFVADGYKKSISEETGRPFDYEKVVPSIFMPKLAARIWLEITNIRVERLQDISEEDARAEGAYKVYEDENGNFYHPEAETARLVGDHGDYKTGFKAIWQSINGKERWISNPWVWVVEFKKVNKD